MTGDTGSLPVSPVQWPGPFGGLPEDRLWEPRGLRTCLLTGGGKERSSPVTVAATGGGGARAWAPLCQAFPPVTPTGMPGGVHSLSGVKHLPSSYCPRALFLADLFSETPGRKSICPLVEGRGGSWEGLVPSPGSQAAAPPGRQKQAG